MATQPKATLVCQLDAAECAIAELADDDLATIFKRLPPYDRLLVSEVCRRWLRINRMAWVDIIHLNLNRIPGPNIAPIVQRCSNLQTVFARGKSFAEMQLFPLSRTCLSSVKLYDCSCSIRDPQLESFNLFSAVFSDRLPDAGWTELVLCGVKVRVDRAEFEGFVTATLPASLKRLQLSGVEIMRPLDADGAVLLRGDTTFLNDVGRLQNLTCLMLTNVRQDASCPCLVGNALDEAYLLPEVSKLKNLRELCIGWDREGSSAHELALLCSLPKLEVLILYNVPPVDDDDDNNLARLATEHPTLRVLVIGGYFYDDYEIPVRRLDFNLAPLPLLHVFVGKEASENILFTRSSASVLQLHAVTAPLPAFLEKEEIAQIFDGVWIAAQIKEGARIGAKVFDYSECATSVRQKDANV